MLKFIEESDFLKVDTFKENEDGSVSWVWDEGEDKPTHSGIIFDGFTRTVDDETIDVWTKLQSLSLSGAITIQPLAIQPLRDNAKQIVNAQRDSLISGGVEYNGHIYQTDTTSITDLMGAILSGIDTTWLTADNVEVPMAAADLQGLGQAVARHKEALVFKARLHKDAIQALSTKEDIDDYLAALTWD